MRSVGGGMAAGDRDRGGGGGGGRGGGGEGGHPFFEGQAAGGIIRRGRM